MHVGMRKWILLLFLLPISVFAQETSDATIQLQDVRPIMDKIFQAHLHEKQMTPTLFLRGISQFISQFDPYHCYLLKKEVDPFLNMHQDVLQRYVEEYKQGNYILFTELTHLFQKAILRTRKIQSLYPIRNILEAQTLVKDRLGALDQPPNDQEQLVDNILFYKAQLILQKTQQGASFEQALQNVTAEMKESEATYLYENFSGKPLSPKEQNHLLAIRILSAFGTSLDAHSSFMNQKEANSLKMHLEQETCGVGILIEDTGSSVIRVSKIFPNSPAAISKKINVGDELLAIDGTPVSQLEVSGIMERLSSPLHTYAKLALKDKKSGKEKSVSLQRTRTIIQEGRVETKYTRFQDGIIGEITLHAFYQGEVSSAEDMKQALATLKKQGKLLGLILDLRDNRGGFLSQAIEVAGLFIKSGVIAIAKRDDIHKLQYFRDIDPSVFYSGPLVLLTSKLTASAAEIVVQALKDYGVAIVVGDPTTYGKGSIQMQTVTNNIGPSYKVTVGTYYTVSGTSTQLQGATADIVAPSFYCNRKIGEKYLHYSLPRDSVSPVFHDTLQDLPSAAKNWYQKNYLPYLQSPTNTYRQYIPTLQQRSAQRIFNNREYYQYILGQNHEQKNLITLQEEIENMQMQEAIYIVEDLIRLKDGVLLKNK